MRWALSCAVGLVALLAAPLAVADDDAPSPDPEPIEAPTAGERVLGVGASLVPGVLLHGSGHFAIGRRRTAYKIAAAEGVGFGMVLAGLSTLAASGASRHLTTPAAALTITGAGLFSLGLVVDLVGVAWPLEDRGRAPLTRPVAELEVGHRAVADRQFAYSHLLYQRLDVSLWGWRLSPSMWLALDDDNARMRLEAAYRPVGPRTDRPSRDGSFIDVRTAVTHHRFVSEGFRTVTTELAAVGRLDLIRFADDLVGQFVELELGAGIQSFDYDVPGLRLGTDVESLLLTRFAHGVYIGKPPEAPYAEVSHFYDHRHDTYAGGLTGFAIGVPGHFGLDARVYPSSWWGVRGRVAVGSAIVGGLSLLTRTPL
jgi:hypothetical protein